MKTEAPKTVAAQRARMRRMWPTFDTIVAGDRTKWIGPLQPSGVAYTVTIDWWPGIPPHVRVLTPPIKPRPGVAFEDVPHLNFDEANPPASPLCLFDPDGNEWNAHCLIADTTVPWAAEWLLRYEQWHLLGIWIGGGSGLESVGAIRRARLAAQAQQQDAAPKTEGIL